ncbi:MAG: hypothetical protein ACLGIR_06230 [Actinomycetes bacterium]
MAAVAGPRVARTRATWLAALVALAALLVPAPAAVAQPAGELVLTSASLPALLPGQRAWLSPTWRATTDVCGVRATATIAGTPTAYPTNTVDHASFYRYDHLAAGGSDFISFDTTMPAAATSAQTLTVTIEFRQAPPGLLKNGRAGALGDKCRGPARSQTFTVPVGVAAPRGGDVVVHTTSLAATAGQATWQEVAVTANVPGFTGAALTVEAPALTAVTYPRDAESSAPASGPDLRVGTRETFGVRLDATATAAGSYPARVVVSGAGGRRVTLDVTVVVR